MAETPRHDLELPGCTPEPLMAYLKALGVLRLVSEQKDATLRGWWENETLRLRSSLDRDALVKFFLEEYKPTPIVAPWAGGSGFFKKDNKKAVEALCSSTSPRCKAYADVIQRVQAIIREENVGDKPKDDDKSRLIRRYRSELPDEVVAWMDAAMVLQQDGQGFAPLLGTGGNDGRLDFTQNFMQRIVSLGLHKNDPADDKSRAWLAQTLFGTPATLDKASVGQFAPGRIGGPNATQGMEGDSIDNPWGFVLMLEGAPLFAGAAVRRLGVAESSRAAFPFTVRTIAVGFDSPAPKDETESRGELWLPLWHRPASMGELAQLFGEGRAEVSGRTARDGADFARAVSGLGVDRGITEFSRLGFLKRSGKAFLATPLGRFQVVRRTGVDLLREVDSWLERFRSAVETSAKTRDKIPPRFASALRAIQSAIFDFCKYGGNTFFQCILIALGRAERELALTPGNVGQSKTNVSPLVVPSGDWISAASDGSTEFRIGLALAGICREPEDHDEKPKIGPIRANLEPVDWGKRCRKWAERDRAVVWKAADLATNLTNVLERRMMDGARAGCERLPLASRHAVSLNTVGAFLAGEVDNERVADLIWGLMLIHDWNNLLRNAEVPGNTPVPRAYALLKLLFLPRPLVIERRTDGRLSGRLRRRHETGGVVIRPEPAILYLLRSDRLGEACAIAMRRLRASGLNPMPKPIRGRGVRDHEWQELDRGGGAGINPRRLAAALLIPIRDDAVSTLVRLAIRNDKIEREQGAPPTGRNSEGGRLP